MYIAVLFEYALLFSNMSSFLSRPCRKVSLRGAFPSLFQLSQSACGQTLVFALTSELFNFNDSIMYINLFLMPWFNTCLYSHTFVLKSPCRRSGFQWGLSSLWQIMVLLLVCVRARSSLPLSWVRDYLGPLPKNSQHFATFTANLQSSCLRLRFGHHAFQSHVRWKQSSPLSCLFFHFIQIAQVPSTWQRGPIETELFMFSQNLHAHSYQQVMIKFMVLSKYDFFYYY